MYIIFSREFVQWAKKIFPLFSRNTHYFCKTSHGTVWLQNFCPKYHPQKENFRRYIFASSTTQSQVFSTHVSKYSDDKNIEEREARTSAERKNYTPKRLRLRSLNLSQFLLCWDRFCTRNLLISTNFCEHSYNYDKNLFVRFF